MFKAKMSQDERAVDIELKVTTFSVKWTVTNFSSRTEESIESPIFSVHAGEKSKWFLRISNSKLEDHLGLHLNLKSCETKVNASAKFSIVYNQRDEMSYLNGVESCDMVTGSEVGIKDFMKREYLFKKARSLLPEDKLTIVCEIVIENHFQIEKETTADGSLDSTDSSNFLGSLLENQKYCDISILVSGATFRAHKVILSARCLFFRTLFETNTNAGQVIINSDQGQEVFQEVLYYIYTEEAPNLEKFADAMLVAAEKFGLDKLKLMCEEVLCKDICIENAAKLYVLANVHEVFLLKSKVIDFIKLNKKQVTESPGWNSMIISHPFLLLRALTEI